MFGIQDGAVMANVKLYIPICADLPPKFLSHPICIPKSLLFHPVLPQYYYSIISFIVHCLLILRQYYYSIILFIVHYLLMSFIIPIYQHSCQSLPLPYDYYDVESYVFPSVKREVDLK